VRARGRLRGIRYSLIRTSAHNVAKAQDMSKQGYVPTASCLMPSRSSRSGIQVVAPSDQSKHAMTPNPALNRTRRSAASFSARISGAPVSLVR
jgi:hypothetical protein